MSIYVCAKGCRAALFPCSLPGTCCAGDGCVTPEALPWPAKTFPYSCPSPPHCSVHPPTPEEEVAVLRPGFRGERWQRAVVGQGPSAVPRGADGAEPGCKNITPGTAER